MQGWMHKEEHLAEQDEYILLIFGSCKEQHSLSDRNVSFRRSIYEQIKKIPIFCELFNDRLVYRMARRGSDWSGSWCFAGGRERAGDRESNRLIGWYV